MKQKTKFEIMQKVIRDNLKNPKGVGDQILESLNEWTKQVEHKHQVSMQCARDGMKETCIEVLKKNKTLSHELKQNLIKKMRGA